MKIRIDQIVCGEKNKGWDLLKTTIQQPDIASKIAYKVSPPDQPPAGISWPPFLRIFTYNDFLLVGRIFLDSSPEVRHGRGFSHFLIMDVSTGITINHLGVLINLLFENIDKERELHPIEFEVNDGLKRQVLVHVNGLRYNKIVKAITAIDESLRTIVWIGTEDFDIASSKLWELLSQEERKQLNIGLYYNPSQLDNTKLNFISTLEITEAKFINSNTFVIRKGDLTQLSDLSDNIFAGDPESLKRLDALLGAIEKSSLSRTEIQKVSKVIPTFENISTVTDFRKVITLSSIVTEFASSPDQAQELKGKIVDRLVSLQELIKPDEILLLRYFRLSAYQRSQTRLGKITESWFKRNLFHAESDLKNDSVSTIFRQLYKSSDQNWLSKQFTLSVNSIIGKASENSINVLSMWLRCDVDIFASIKSKIENTKEAESIFVRYIEKPISNKEFEILKDFALERGWLLFHASLVKKYFHPMQALKAQLTVDLDSKYLEGVNLLAKDLKDFEVLEIALTHGDDRLITLAGESCYRNPKLLNAFEVTSLTWQNIWVVAIDLGANIGTGFKDIRLVVHRFFDSIVQNKTYNSQLLLHIAESSFSNLLDYSNRDKLWPKLPASVKRLFLVETSSKLLLGISKDPTFNIPPDKVISDFIVKENFIGTFLYYNKANIRATLPLFEKFHLSEEIIDTYLNNYQGNIDFDVAENLGRYIRLRKFKNVSLTVYRRAKHEPDFRGAIPAIYDLFDVIKQVKIALKGWSNSRPVSETKWWFAFTSVIIDLMPRGAHEHEIWIHAGGNPAKLKINVTGEESWVHAMSLIKNGKKGAPYFDDFVHELQRQFSNVKALSELLAYRDKHYR